MFQNSIVIRQRYEKFLVDVVKNEIVWTLKAEEGFVTGVSNLYEDGNEEDIRLYFFWSYDKLARVCKKKFWDDCDLVEISLPIFLENWCLGLHNDDLMIGINPDWNLHFQETEPILLILEIVNQLKKKAKNLHFNNFRDLAHIEVYAKKIYQELYKEE